jgi:hypothetical protein
MWLPAGRYMAIIFSLKIRDKMVANKNDYDDKIIKYILGEFYKHVHKSKKDEFRL